MSKYASFEGFEAAFMQQIDVNNSWAKKISAYFEKTNTEDVRYATIGSSKGVELWPEGSTRNELSPSNMSLVITNQRYEDSMPIPKNAYQRDSLGLFENGIRGMANGFNSHYDTLLGDLIALNSATGPAVGYDGKPFVGSTHPKYDGTSQTNLLSATEVPALNVSTAASPTVVESALIIAGITAYMKDYRAENGQRCTQSAKSFVILTGTVAVYSAMLGAVMQNHLTSGESNIVTSLGLDIEVVYDSSIASSTTFYVARTDGNKPFILQSERGIEFASVTDPNDGTVVKTGNFIFAAEDTRGVGIGDWRSFVKCTLS